MRAEVAGASSTRCSTSVNQGLADYEQLRMIVVAREPWSIENGQLTPTMKIKRSRIEAAVAPQVERWYADAAEGAMGLTRLPAAAPRRRPHRRRRCRRRACRCVFTLCGGHISPILSAAKARGIRIVDVRDEATAVFAADAAARLTGGPASPR